MTGKRWAVLILPAGPTAPGARGVRARGAGLLGGGDPSLCIGYSVLPRRWPQPLLETAAAVAFLRSHAAEYGFRADRVAVCGFSAGGHLAGYLSGRWEDPAIGAALGLTPDQVRPDAAVLGYPVVHLAALMEEIGAPEALRLDRQVRPGHPPVFLWATVRGCDRPGGKYAGLCPRAAGGGGAL